MSLSSSQLEAFLAVARTGNFTKAAQTVNVTQSALSQRVLNLEAELEAALFVRDRAGLRLTEIGQELVRYCQTKETLENQFLSGLKNQVHGALSGTIRIAGFSSVMRAIALPVLAELLQKHDDLQLELMTKEIDDLLPLLKSGEVDFIISPLIYNREELESQSLGVEKNVLIEKKNYKGPDVYLDHDTNDRTTRDYLKISETKLSRLRRRYLDDVYGILDGVKLGYGRAVMPKHMIEDEKQITILAPRTVLEIPVSLYYFKQPYYSKLHQAVAQHLKTGFGEVLK